MPLPWRLPVPEPCLQEQRLRQVLDAAVQGGVTTALSAAVMRPSGETFIYAAGQVGEAPGLPEVDTKTVFDLASLTKLLSTTLLMASAVSLERIGLEERPWPFWPAVSVAQVMAHCGGVLWWAPFYEKVAEAHEVGTPVGRARVLEAAQATELQCVPGTKTRYSDIGFLALTSLLEGRLGNRLDRLLEPVARVCFGETGLRYVSLPDAGYHPALPNVAHTEKCSWRRRVLVGQVHDDNTFAMGGVSGHAGLFGDVHDVLAAGRFFRRALCAQMTSNDDPAAEAIAAVLRQFAVHPSERPLGFDRATAGGSTGGGFSDEAVGHLGFTGTSLWIDPAPTGGIYVLLTNRVHPSRERDAIKALRPAFHRAAANWVVG